MKKTYASSALMGITTVLISTATLARAQAPQPIKVGWSQEICYAVPPSLSGNGTLVDQNLFASNGNLPQRIVWGHAQAGANALRR